MYMAKTIKLKIEVPNQLADITLDQYQRYFQVLDNIDKEGKDAEMFINLKALEIFCGLELKESYKLPISHFSVVLEKIAGCLSEDTPLIKRFWLRGSNGVEVEFGMNPDLGNISFGEYVDLESYIGDWKLMHKAMAVLFRPITAKKDDFYEIEEYESSNKYADYMRYMPASVAIGALVFFYRLGTKLSGHMTSYLVSQGIEEAELLAGSKFSGKSGAGINPSMLSPLETLQNSTK